MPRAQYTRVCEFCGNVFSRPWTGSRSCSYRCRNLSRPRPSLAERFWAKVAIPDDPDACWLWIAGKDEHGYGRFAGAKSRPQLAHRVCYELVNGPIPAGLEVCHNCPGGDNPSCVNPAHLFLGTQADNMRDMAKKGRGVPAERAWLRLHPERNPTKLNPGLVRGEQNGGSKLTRDLVGQIRRFHAESPSVSATARAFGLARTTVRDVINGRTWAHEEAG